ncbi:carbamoyltransferase HypF [Clostridioides difficile]
MEKYRKLIEVKGIVQGVGFRPFVYNLAIKYKLLGWVNNNGNGVIIDIEGSKENIYKFIENLKNNPPPLANIISIKVLEMNNINYKSFSIKISNNNLKATTYISPDFSICPQCKEEIFDVNNRRYKYPFTNCTNCGPRFSIIKELPYDRQTTTMKEFEMCDKCKEEYSDPINRRFHAQPNACPVCGPKVLILNNVDKEIKCESPLNEVIELLKKGNIFAIKGLGGFNLVCDGKNENAISLLRQRKKRPTKPLAVMMKDLDTVKKYCTLNEKEEKLLKSKKRPIVLLKKIEDFNLPQNLAPNNKKLGVMIPYTPLHYLLFDNSLDVLVMTSANISGQPMIYTNDDAVAKLAGVVDYYLIHDRDIYISIDDSVSKVSLNEERVIRPARGYAPYTFSLETSEEILSLGSQMKNTVALSNKKDIFISEYIGDLENIDTLNNLENVLKHFIKIYDIKPKVVVYDKHPDFTYKYIDMGNILEAESEIKFIEVQHHHSHIVSCMTENNINTKVIGIAFDGTGYGEDKTIWGGEFIICDKKSFKRMGHLDYFNLPGGESAIKEPWKIGISLLYKTYKDEFNKFIPKHFQNDSINVIKTMIDNNINSPKTSSIGRLFDGVASLIGFSNKITFEGESAIYLENISDEQNDEVYEFQIEEIDNNFILKFENIIKNIINDININKDIKIISKRFHNTIIKSTVEIALKIREKSNINIIAISGGVFQNEILFRGIVNGLKEYGFQVLTHNNIPCNDSGISLGQLVIASELIKEERGNRQYVYSSTSKN